MPEDETPPSTFSERLKAIIDDFLVRSGMSASEFGQRVINDTSLYTRIKRGRPVTSNTVDLIEALIRRHDAQPRVGAKARAPTSQKPKASTQAKSK